MIFRHAETEDIAGISSLWDKCFPGDEDFRDYFLSEIFDPGRTLVCEDNRQVVSMAHVLPAHVDYHTKVIPAGYIFAVGTDPDHRGKGLASILMERFFTELRQMDIPLAVLVPQKDSLFEFYRRSGFAGIFSVSRERLVREKLPDIPPDADYMLLRSNLASRSAGEDVVPSVEDISSANTIYENVMIFRTHLKRTDEHWTRAVKIAEIAGGGMFVLKKDGVAAGYAICEMCEEGLLINELLCEDEISFNALRAGVLDRMGVSGAVMLTPACPHDACRFGMVRVIDAEKMLAYAAAYRSGMECSFDLLDKQAGWNTARFEINGGVVSRSEYKNSKAFITPSQLAEILFGAGPIPYINLMFS